MHDLWVQFHVLNHVITMSSALGSDMDVRAREVELQRMGVDVYLACKHYQYCSVLKYCSAVQHTVSLLLTWTDNCSAICLH